MVSGCKGRVRAVTSESQANDTLRYLQGLFNVDKYLNELQMNAKGKENTPSNSIPHAVMLDHVMSSVN